LITLSLDPDAMTSEARLAEVAHILAQAYLRLKFRQKESNCLDVLRHPTAPCVSDAIGDGARPRKETA